VSLFENSGLGNLFIELWIPHIRNMYQYCNLLTMPVHRRHLVLHFHEIILAKIDPGENSVWLQPRQSSFELFLLPLQYEVVQDILDQLRFQVFY
jgi:hypothetical protein